MTTVSRLSRFLLCLALTVVFVPLAAAAQEELAAEVLIEGTEGSSTMRVMLGSEGQLRMDMGGAQGEVSTVFKPDGMLMIMHSQKMYMEFDKEMLERMQQMMGGMGQQQMEEVDSFDPSSVTFETTGNTETINGMDSFEVLVQTEDGKTSHVWVTEEAEHGLFEVFSRMLEPLSAMRMPGMNRGDNPMQKMRTMMQVARAQGLPDGKVIRVVAEGSSMTLSEVTTGPLGDVWNAPDGFQKQSMPRMGQRR